MLNLNGLVEVRDFLDFGELLCRDALERNESCGGHFREEYQTDEEKPPGMMKILPMLRFGNTRVKKKMPTRHKEELKYDNVKLAVRSYK